MFSMSLFIVILAKRLVIAALVPQLVSQSLVETHEKIVH